VRIFTGRTATRAVVALAGASLLATACGAGGSTDSSGSGSGDSGASAAPGDTTGVTDGSIKIGTTMPLTGVASPGYSTIPQGQKAYFDYVNAKGGVCGRKIELVVRDDGYNPANTSQVTNQLVLQDEIFGMIGALGTPTHNAVVDYLNEQKVPDLFVSSGALAWDQPEKYPFTFGWQPNYAVEGKIMGQYVKENFPDAKVGLFLQGDDFGRDGGEAAKKYIGDQLVAEVKYTSGNTDVGPQIAELKAKGADLVMGFNVPAYTALSQLTAQKLQYKPTWFYSNVGSDATLVGSLLDNFSKGAVKGEGALEGIYTNKYIPTVEQPDNPWTQLFTQVWQENGANDEPLNNFRVFGMSQAYTLAASMAADCENLTREGIVKSVENNGKDIKGPWLAPLDYSADSHRGISGVQVVQLVGGKPVEKTKVLLTDSEDGEITEYTEPAATPENDGVPKS